MMIKLSKIITEVKKVTVVITKADAKEATKEVIRKLQKDGWLNIPNKTGAKEIMKQIKPQIKNGGGTQKVVIDIDKVDKFNIMGEI